MRPFTYSVPVSAAAALAGGSPFKLWTWVVSPDAGAPTLRVAGSSSVYAGGVSSVAASWTVPTGTRYLSVINFKSGAGADLGFTQLMVDNH